MKRKIALLALGLVCLHAAVGSADESRYVDAVNRFGFKLNDQLFSRQPEQNLIFSPASVAMALAMVYHGAAGQTKQAIAQTLEVQGLTSEEINAANRSLLDLLLQPDSEATLSIANSLWVPKDIVLKVDFLKRNADFYRARTAFLDFGSPQSVKTINDWVSQATRGKIPSILDHLDRLTFVLINAIYFKGLWVKPFDKAQTQQHPFTRLDGSRKDVAMMSQAGGYSYYRGNEFQLVRLPYKGERISFYLCVPDVSDGMRSLQPMLSADRWKQWVGRMEWHQGTVMLPRFIADYKAELNAPLKALGMDVAFDKGNADFSGIVEPPNKAWLDKVLHKALIEVNEEGTEAAAVTAVIAITGMAPNPAEPFRIVADHPFFLIIQDDRSGLILFAGSIIDPQPASQGA